MQGLSMFLHAVRVVFANWLEASKISAVPLCGLGLVFGVLMYPEMSTLAALDGTYDPTIPDGFAGYVLRLLIVFVLALVVVLAIAVNWHRFILLEEYPEGWLPPLHFGRVLGYLGRLLLLMILSMLAALPFAVVILPMAGYFSSSVAQDGVSEDLFWSPAFLMFEGVSLIISFAITYVLMRLSIILPSGAVEKPLTLSQAWTATGKAPAAIAVLVAVWMLVQFALSGLPLLGAVGVALFVPAYGVYSMVSVSILTVLFGVFVEDRDLG